jgi:hypothetical protein
MVLDTTSFLGLIYTRMVLHTMSFLILMVLDLILPLMVLAVPRVLTLNPEFSPETATLTKIP